MKTSTTERTITTVDKDGKKYQIILRQIVGDARSSKAGSLMQEVHGQDYRTAEGESAMFDAATQTYKFNRGGKLIESRDVRE